MSNWLVRGVAFFGSLLFAMGSTGTEWHRDPIMGLQITGAALLLFAVLLATGDITIGKDW